jgi:putative addiction module component (TIGR02574 family)
MSNQTQTVLDAAMALPEAERLWLVERLMETLPPDVDEMTDDELYAELERRRAEVEKDPSAAIPWKDVVMGE